MCKVMEAAGTGFDKIVEEYSHADQRHKPYIYSASDHFTLVLPDLTYDIGIATPVEAIEYVPIANETKYDSKVLSFCISSAHSASEIANHLGISDSTYLRKKVLGNLVQQGHLIETKSSWKKMYLANPKMMRLA